MKLTRRDLIRMGAGASLLPLAGVWNTSVANPGETIYATVPSTGEKLPCVGIGTVDYRGGTGSAAMDPLSQCLALFHSLGGRVVDTSPNYGNSEEVLAHLLNGLKLRDQVFMATKVDREDPDEGVERMESSFQRLGKPIDLMQVHNLRGTDAELKTMMEWKAQGRFRYIGVTTHRDSQHAEMEAVMRKYPLDFIQVNYSVTDRAAAKRILPLAQDRGMAVLVNRPFGDGKLFSVTRDVSLPPWAIECDAQSWAQVFLKYIIAHPAATIPIPGMTKPRHVQDNMGAMVGRLPDESVRKEIEAFMNRLLQT
jgi:aryl-alcohol dehydrogenase-like predicted oxidoreductase